MGAECSTTSKLVTKRLHPANRPSEEACEQASSRYAPLLVHSRLGNAKHSLRLSPSVLLPARCLPHYFHQLGCFSHETGVQVKESSKFGGEPAKAQRSNSLESKNRSALTQTGRRRASVAASLGFTEIWRKLGSSREPRPKSFERSASPNSNCQRFYKALQKLRRVSAARMGL